VNLKEKVEHISELMRTMKNDWVATGSEMTDLAIYLHFYRDDELVVAVVCPLDRDTALEAAFLGAMGFCATTTTITFESYHTELAVSPITGKAWVPGEMERLIHDDPEAVDKGWMYECVTTTGHERGGGYVLVSMPYRIKEGQVVWQDSVMPPEGVTGGGLMFDSLQHSMSQPTLMERVEEAAQGDPVAGLISGLITDPELRQFHTDMATFQALQERELIISAAFTAKEGSDRQKWIEERFVQSDEA
jgi:hypothetical protein